MDGCVPNFPCALLTLCFVTRRPTFTEIVAFLEANEPGAERPAPPQAAAPPPLTGAAPANGTAPIGSVVSTAIASNGPDSLLPDQHVEFLASQDGAVSDSGDAGSGGLGGLADEESSDGYDNL